LHGTIPLYYLAKLFVLGASGALQICFRRACCYTIYLNILGSVWFFRSTT